MRVKIERYSYGIIFVKYTAIRTAAITAGKLSAPIHNVTRPKQASATRLRPIAKANAGSFPARRSHIGHIREIAGCTCVVHFKISAYHPRRDSGPFRPLIFPIPLPFVFPSVTLTKLCAPAAWLTDNLSAPNVMLDPLKFSSSVIAISNILPFYRSMNRKPIIKVHDWPPALTI